jgi:probable rRNA maturation factor
MSAGDPSKRRATPRPRDEAARAGVRVTISDGRGRRVAAPGLARWMQTHAPSRARGEVGVALVSDRRMRDLNRTFRGKDAVTDVLSFPSDGDAATLGDIVIATGVAARQAGAAGHPLATELRVLALHGLLHLVGYDHETDEGRMARVEARLRRKAGLPAGLIERERAR